MLKLKVQISNKGREDNIFPFFNARCKWLFVFRVICFFAGIIIVCPATFAATYKVTGNVVGQVQDYTVGEEDTLYAIARKFDVGLLDIMSANPGVDVWVPGEGRVIKIPTFYVLPDAKRSGIVINLSELRLYYFPDKDTVMTFPVGIGREGWQTPAGETTIIAKRKDPVWIPPDSIRAEKPDLPKIVPAGPDNPMGQYALSLGWTSYAIHGTNKPYGIGLRSSHGCIRMYPEDIKVLFEAIKKGTKVMAIDNPYKLSWVDKDLYLEASPLAAQTSNILNGEDPDNFTPAEVYGNIEKMAGDKAEINWKIVDEALIRRTGVPVNITLQKEGENQQQEPEETKMEDKENMGGQEEKPAELDPNKPAPQEEE